MAQPSGRKSARPAKGTGEWIDYYNQRRPFASLYSKTLDDAYWELANLWTTEAAA